MESAPVKKVYSALCAVMAEMAVEGISKDRKNQQQNYAFRGIDDVYQALASKLAAHKLLVLPRVVGREQVERQTSKGSPLFYTSLTVEYDLVSAEDGSTHTICTVGEAMDSADKSSNKAMSAAYKYAMIQALCIPTEGDNDADATTHEVAPRQAAQQRQAASREAPMTVEKLTQKLREAAMLGTAEFTRVWQANKGPARDHIAKDKTAMANLQAACQEADRAEGEDAHHHDQQQEAR